MSRTQVIILLFYYYFIIILITFFFNIYFYNSNSEDEIIFCVERFQSQAQGRVVKYSLKNQYFSCSCNYFNFSGIICRHIFRVASQLNLEEISPHLFISRWRKDPSEQTLITIYQEFYNSIGVNLNQQVGNGFKDDDYEYLLNRIWQKVRLIVKTKAETAKTFYTLLNELVEKEIAIQILETTPQNTEQIKNPTSIKPKGKY